MGGFRLDDWHWKPQLCHPCTPPSVMSRLCGSAGRREGVLGGVRESCELVDVLKHIVCMVEAGGFTVKAAWALVPPESGGRASSRQRRGESEEGRRRRRREGGREGAGVSTRGIWKGGQRAKRQRRGETWSAKLLCRLQAVCCCCCRSGGST